MSFTETIRQWAISLCATGIGCAIVSQLCPGKGMGRLMKIMTAAVFLCCLFEPLLGNRLSAGLLLDGLPETVQNEILAGRVSEQLTGQVKEAVAEQARIVLQQRHITAKNISAETDIGADGGIYIKQITVTLDKQNAAYSLTVSQLMEQQFGVPVKLILSEGDL